MPMAMWSAKYAGKAHVKCCMSPAMIPAAMESLVRAAMIAVTVMARAAAPTAAIIVTPAAHVQAALLHNQCSTKVARNNASKIMKKAALVRVKRHAQAINDKTMKHLAKIVHLDKKSVRALTRNSMVTVSHRANVIRVSAALVIVLETMIAAAMGIAPAIVVAAMIARKATVHKASVLKVSVRLSTPARAKIAPKVIARKGTVRAAMKGAAKALATAMANKFATAPPVTARRLPHAGQRA